MRFSFSEAARCSVTVSDRSSSVRWVYEESISFFATFSTVSHCQLVLGKVSASHLLFLEELFRRQGHEAIQLIPGSEELKSLVQANNDPLYQRDLAG